MEYAERYGSRENADSDCHGEGAENLFLPRAHLGRDESKDCAVCQTFEPETGKIPGLIEKRGTHFPGEEASQNRVRDTDGDTDTEQDPASEGADDEWPDQIEMFLYTERPERIVEARDTKPTAHVCEEKDRHQKETVRVRKNE